MQTEYSPGRAGRYKYLSMMTRWPSIMPLSNFFKLSTRVGRGEMCLSMNAAMVWFSGLRHHQLVGGRLVGLVQLLALSAAALAAAGCFAAKFARFKVVGR